LSANEPTELLLLGGDDGSIIALNVADPESPQVHWQATVDDGVQQVALSHHGQFAVAQGKKLTAWDLASGEVVVRDSSLSPVSPTLSPVSPLPLGL
jgi:hypothetical protein